MHPIFAKKRSTVSLRRKRSEASFVTSMTPSHQKPREEKSTLYGNPSYGTLLEDEGGTYMNEHELANTDASESLCQTLIEGPITRKIPYFATTFSKKTCRKLQSKNEAKTIQDTSRVLVPSAKHWQHLVPITLASWWKASGWLITFSAEFSLVTS